MGKNEEMHYIDSDDQEGSVGGKKPDNSNVVTMKRQMSVQNFFVKKQNVTNDEIEVSNSNVPSAVVDIVPVAKDCLPNQEVTKNHYDTGNSLNESSVRSLTNEERFSLFDNA
ncbi:Hypothetical protein CINCED_3A020580 [Cinara cedri]|uniref:Uncharacterized protein n=1 Tax=Cinara cedri TaxID=506608 RepID=A0A5E4M036_9HEMI|nr:Hypothetical protein CINCED_3A020580 [Cinara cedri]